MKRKYNFWLILTIFIPILILSSCKTKERNLSSYSAPVAGLPPAILPPPNNFENYFPYNHSYPPPTVGTNQGPAAVPSHAMLPPSNNLENYSTNNRSYPPPTAGTNQGPVAVPPPAMLPPPNKLEAHSPNNPPSSPINKKSEDIDWPNVFAKVLGLIFISVLIIAVV